MYDTTYCHGIIFGFAIRGGIWSWNPDPYEDVSPYGSGFFSFGTWTMIFFTGQLIEVQVITETIISPSISILMRLERCALQISFLVQVGLICVYIPGWFQWLCLLDLCWQRINVSISRAKKAVVILGNRETLESDPQWRRVLRDTTEILSKHGKDSMGGLINAIVK